MHPWLHFKTITKHKLLVMHYCFRAGMYKQDCFMTCPNMHLWNFWLDVNTIRETEVPTMQKEKIQEYQNPGFIIKGATNIILSTG